MKDTINSLKKELDALQDELCDAKSAAREIFDLLNVERRRVDRLHGALRGLLETVENALEESPAMIFKLKAGYLEARSIARAALADVERK